VEQFIYIYYSVFFQLIAGFIPLVVLWVRKVKADSALVGSIGLSFVISLILIITGYFKQNNFFFFNTYAIGSVILFGIFYYRSIENKKMQYFVLATTVLCVLIFFFELSRKDVISVTIKFQNVFYIIWSLLFFIDFMLKSNFTDAKSKSTLIIIAAIFLYNCTSFILLNHIDLFLDKNLWVLHNFSESACKLMIAYAFWKLPKLDEN
jgi:hypothetical protein